MANEHIYTVSEITRYIKSMIDQEPSLQNFWLRGEISNFKHHKASGHMYFSVKDEKAKIQAVMFYGYNRYLSFEPKDGMKVLIRGNVSVYEISGVYQLYAYEMLPDGIGSLFLAYEQLKEKLAEEGLFREEHKKPIPSFATRIGIVTSPTGAAIRDIVTTIKRRFPIAKISLFPVLVQGEGAANSIVRAIRYANQLNRFDVLIVGRGGGSIEELWAFNEEEVARAVYASNIPIISAVGHETDFTICDFVADLRAATPTAAAELSVPDRRELINQIQHEKRRLIRSMQEMLNQKKGELARLKKSYAFRYPEQLLRQKKQELDYYFEQIEKEMKRIVAINREKLENLSSNLKRNHPQHLIEKNEEKLENIRQMLIRNFKDRLKEKQFQFHQLVTKLDLLSPLKMMDRGYSLSFTKDNRLIKSIHDVKLGESLRVDVQDGRLYCTVDEKSERS